MFEAFGLVFFAGVVYLFLVVVPTAIEFIGNEEFSSFNADSTDLRSSIWFHILFRF